MRPSPRLSFFVILAGIVLTSAPVFSTTYEYDMSCDGDDSLVSSTSAAAWDCHSIVKNDNHVGYNAGGDYIETKNATQTPITNVWIKYRSSAVNGGRKLYFKPMDENGARVAEQKEFSVPEKAKYVTTNFVFAASDNVRKLKIIAEGSSNTWIIHSITISTIDPPPSLGPIASRSVGMTSEIDHHPLYASTSVAGDNLVVSVSTTSGIPSASYGVFEESGNWYFRFDPGDAGVQPGDIIPFTASATGIGGTTNLTFSITVTEGVVKTPPTIDQIANQSVLALRTLTVPFTVREADGDAITTNYICSTAGVTGLRGFDENDNFSYTPALADAALVQPITFGIEAFDGDGAVTNYFNVTVTTGTPPVIGTIAAQTVAYGGTNTVTLALTPTDQDEITATNVAVKAETPDPDGDYSFSNLVFRFVPAVTDIGKTFTFVATASDFFDGTTTNEFTVAVILAKPELAHCTVDKWGTNYFTAELVADVPGAEGYRLKYEYKNDQGETIPVVIDEIASWPFIVENAPSTNLTYYAQAYAGEVDSAWSAGKSMKLHTWAPYIPAIRMTKDSGGIYTQDFNTLLKSGTGKWYDGRTLPGWHTCWYGRTITDTSVNYEAFAYTNNNSHQGFFSFENDGEDSGNRAFGMRNDAYDAYAQIGVAFTNECRYAVTNIFISFTAAQFRDAAGISWLRVQYAKTDAVRSLHQGDWPEGQSWKNASTFDFKSPVNIKAQPIQPKPASETRSGNIALTGDDAIQPGEVLLIQWWMDAPNNGAPMGIDDLTVSWQCAWPRHTVFSVR